MSKLPGKVRDKYKTTSEEGKRWRSKQRIILRRNTEEEKCSREQRKILPISLKAPVLTWTVVLGQRARCWRQQHEASGWINLLASTTGPDHSKVAAQGKHEIPPWPWSALGRVEEIHGRTTRLGWSLNSPINHWPTFGKLGKLIHLLPKHCLSRLIKHNLCHALFGSPLTVVTHLLLLLTTAEGGGDSLQGLLQVTSSFPFELSAGWVHENIAHLLGFVAKNYLKPSKNIPFK